MARTGLPTKASPRRGRCRLTLLELSVCMLLIGLVGTWGLAGLRTALGTQQLRTAATRLERKVWALRHSATALGRPLELTLHCGHGVVESGKPPIPSLALRLRSVELEWDRHPVETLVVRADAHGELYPAGTLTLLNRYGRHDLLIQ